MKHRLRAERRRNIRPHTYGRYVVLQNDKNNNGSLTGNRPEEENNRTVPVNIFKNKNIFALIHPPTYRWRLTSYRKKKAKEPAETKNVTLTTIEGKMDETLTAGRIATEYPAVHWN